jgi:Fe-S-cluster containining protein
MRIPLLLDTPVSRECGACTACCTILAVRELNKNVYEACQHLCAQGCSIYTDRPRTCRAWSCMWREGKLEGDERRRPDQLGVMFWGQGLPDGRAVIMVSEVWPGAADLPAARYMIEKLAKARQRIVIKTVEGYRCLSKSAEQLLQAIIEYRQENPDYNSNASTGSPA